MGIETQKNTTAIVSGLIILVMTLLSLFAYLVIPDNTAQANRHIPLLSLKSPFYKQDVLVYNGRSDNYTFSIKHLFYGKRQNYDLLPFDSLLLDKGQLQVFFSGALKLIDPCDVGKIETGFQVPCNEDSDKLIATEEELLNFIELSTEEIQYLFGSDKYGRDVLSRIVLGLRISLLVGFFAVILSTIVGTMIGSLAGYYGGLIDRMTMIVINTAWSIPTLLMAFAIIIAFGKGLVTIIVAIGLTMWVDVARIVRGLVLRLKEELYVQAGLTSGLSSWRILVRHIIPNMLGPILVISAANFATAILVEAGLSFLGMGIQPPAPSLGTMLKENYAYITGGFVYLAIFPILTIMILVLNFNMLGTSLRDIFDVKTTTK